MSRFLIPSLFFAVVLFTGCAREETPPDQKDGSTESLDDYKTRRLKMEKEKNDLYRQMKEQLDRTQRELDELKADARKSGKYKNPDYRQRIDNLQQKEFNLRDDLEKIKNASLVTWEDLKPRLRAALDDLVGGLQDAISEFRFSRPSPQPDR